MPWPDEEEAAAEPAPAEPAPAEPAPAEPAPAEAAPAEPLPARRRRRKRQLPSPVAGFPQVSDYLGGAWAFAQSRTGLLLGARAEWGSYAPLLRGLIESLTPRVAVGFACHCARVCLPLMDRTGHAPEVLAAVEDFATGRARWLIMEHRQSEWLISATRATERHDPMSVERAVTTGLSAAVRAAELAEASSPDEGGGRPAALTGMAYSFKGSALTEVVLEAYDGACTAFWLAGEGLGPARTSGVDKLLSVDLQWLAIAVDDQKLETLPRGLLPFGTERLGARLLPGRYRQPGGGRLAVTEVDLTFDPGVGDDQAREFLGRLAAAVEGAGGGFGLPGGRADA